MRNLEHRRAQRLGPGGFVKPLTRLRRQLGLDKPYGPQRSPPKSAECSRRSCLPPNAWKSHRSA